MRPSCLFSCVRATHPLQDYVPNLLIVNSTRIHVDSDFVPRRPRHGIGAPLLTEVTSLMMKQCPVLRFTHPVEGDRDKE